MRTWHRKALAGEWFTKRRRKSMPAPTAIRKASNQFQLVKEFFALADTCQAAAINVNVKAW